MPPPSNHPTTQQPEPTRVTVLGHEDVELVGDAWGDPSAPPILFLHGGGQTRHAWGNAGAAMGARGWSAVSMDARGHGDRSWSPDGDYSFHRLAEDYRAIMRTFSTAPVVVGASMGGLTTLIAEGEAAEPGARAIILVDIAPRTDAEGVQRILQFMGAHPDGFSSLEEAADAVAAYRNHRSRSKDHSGLKKNLRLHDDGRYRWHWDPAVLESFWSSEHRISMERMDDASRGLRVPTLLVRGGSSDVVSKEGAEHFLELVPHASYVDVAEAGHMVAGDRNDVFVDAILQFLDTLDDAPPPA